MALRYDTVSFLSDFGYRDEFVGVVKSVIRSFTPDVTVIDVTHDIAAHDIRAGGLALARAAQYLNPGVVLAVVDPGVGTDRRGVVVEVGDGMSMLVGPDNGLLAPAVAFVGGASRAFDITASAVRIPAPGATFDGRDLFAPVAAQLCAGVAPGELGVEIDPASLRPAIVPVSGTDGDTVLAEVLWIDRFGNAQLNIDPDDLAGANFTLTVESMARPVRVVHSYGEIASGEIGLVVDSYGLISISVNGSSAAFELRLGEGDSVRLQPGGGDVATAGAASPVTISMKDRS